MNAVVNDRYSTPDQPRFEDNEVVRLLEHDSEMWRWVVVKGHAVTVRGEPEIDQPLVSTALKEAEAEGVAWTPYLDLLVSAGVWPDRDGYHRSFYTGDGEDLPSPAQWLDASPLPAWIAECDTPEAIDGLLTFETPEVWGLVARFGENLSAEQVQALLADGPRGMAHLLWNNDHITGESRSAVVRDAYRTWSSETKTVVVDAALKGQLPAGVRDDVVAYASRYGYVTDWMGRGGDVRKVAEDPDHLVIAAYDPNASAEDLEAVAMAGNDRVRAHVASHPNVSAELLKTLIEAEDRRGWIAHLGRTGYARTPIPSPEVLTRILGQEDLHEESVAQLVQVPTITLPMLRAIARERTEPEVRAALAQVDEARKDPEIREQILASRSPRVADVFIEHATPDEFPKAFRVLAQYEPEAAADALARVPDGAELSPDDLRNLLESEHQATRLAAIQFLGRMRDDEPALGEPEGRSRS